MRFVSVVVVSLLVISIRAAEPPLVAPTEARTPDEERKCFHLPPGFDVELVACEPEIHKPINMNFDDKGRLWVTDTIEYPYAVAAGKKGRDSVKILEDFDEKGRAKKITTFADGLNIPIGILPMPHKPGAKGSSAIVFSIPNLWKMTDTDGDGVADQREVLFGPFGQRDTHGLVNGLTWGFDGWVYACHGFANDSEVAAKDGSKVKMNSGNTFRFKPDGSRIEQWTWGQVNPFGMCFDSMGNLFTADCHSRPIMMLLRGGHYQSFGKPHDGLGFAPEICFHDHGSTGIAGIVCYEATHFPEDFRKNIFIGNPVTSRINRDKLAWTGSSPKCVLQPDFLSSDDPWFRPVDLKLGPDGALYVADFYNKIIGHYEVPLTHPGRDRERGRIWRIVYRGPDGKGKAEWPRRDWTKASLKDLIGDVSGKPTNQTVEFLALNQLVLRGLAGEAKAIRKLILEAETLSPACMWVLERLGAPHGEVAGAYNKCREAERDECIDSFRHLCRILAERAGALPENFRDGPVGAGGDAPSSMVIGMSEIASTHLDPGLIQPLLGSLERTGRRDVMLVHMLRIALRNQLRNPTSWKELGSWSLTDSQSRLIADVCPGIQSAEAAAFLVKHILKHAEIGDNLSRYMRHVARFGTEDVVQKLVLFAKTIRADDLRHQTLLLKAIHQGTQERGGKLSEEGQKWAEGVIDKLLAAKEADLMQSGIELAGSLRLASRQEMLIGLLNRGDLDEGRRLATANALIAIDAKRYLGWIGRIVGDAAEPIGLREKIAGLVGGINQPESRVELLKALPTAPARLQNAIALGLTASPQGAESLLETISAGKASARLLQEPAVKLRLEQTQLPNLSERVAKLTAGLPPVEQRFAELYQKRKAGFASFQTDLALGKKVFEKHCAICHQLGNQGTKIGPQLDGIGIRGMDRLLEDILDPNRNVDQAFRSTLILQKNGQTVSGLVLREEGEIVVLADAQGKEVRVPKNTIDEQKTSQLSPMPANQVDQIPEAEFYQLLGYLLSQRATDAKK